jgi:RNA polymerase sigma-70 factor (ECF subfamily)
MPLPNPEAVPDPEATDAEVEAEELPADPTADLGESDWEAAEADPETAEIVDEEELGSRDPADPVKNIPQPSSGVRVKKDMATVAVQPLAGAAASAAAEAALAANRGFIADYSRLDDAVIMLRVRDGDESGYEFLVQKYRRAMVHFMFRMTRNQAIAEELAQEVFLRVYRSRATYRAEARFTTWLYRIATNLAVNNARDSKLESSASNVYLDAADPETGTRPDVADETPNIEQDLVRDERLSAIRAHVYALPERQRVAVLMHKYQGLDYREIGRVLKLSESATKSLLFRAYETLRDKLKEFV